MIFTYNAVKINLYKFGDVDMLSITVHPRSVSLQTNSKPQGWPGDKTEKKQILQIKLSIMLNTTELLSL